MIQNFLSSTFYNKEIYNVPNPCFCVLFFFPQSFIGTKKKKYLVCKRKKSKHFLEIFRSCYRPSLIVLSVNSNETQDYIHKRSMTSQ